MTCRSHACKIGRSRFTNRVWAESNRNVRQNNPWLTGPPPYGPHLPGGGFELHVSPAPQWPIELRNTRALHGMVTELLGRPHHPTIPGFSLVPWATGVRWGVYTQHADDAARVAGKEHEMVLFDRRVKVRCGPLVRLRSPQIKARGHRRLRIDAITPVLVRQTGVETGLGPTTYTGPTAGNLHSSLDVWLPRRIGMQPFGPRCVVRLVESETRGEAVALGGKYGRTLGWVGHVIVDTNAVGHWLFEVASRIGYGGRVALGFGRIRVTQEE